MTSVTDEVTAQRRTQGPKCGLKRFLATQPAEDAAEFLRLILTSTESPSAIWRALARRGYAGGRERVQFHRSGGWPWRSLA